LSLDLDLDLDHWLTLKVFEDFGTCGFRAKGGRSYETTSYRVLSFLKAKPNPNPNPNRNPISSLKAALEDALLIEEGKIFSDDTVVRAMLAEASECVCVCVCVCVCL